MPSALPHDCAIVAARRVIISPLSLVAAPRGGVRPSSAPSKPQKKLRTSVAIGSGVKLAGKQRVLAENGPLPSSGILDG
jgi:hypothetical protein